MTLGAKLSDFWHRLQGELFPALADEIVLHFEILLGVPGLCAWAFPRM